MKKRRMKSKAKISRNTNLGNRNIAEVVSVILVFLLFALALNLNNHSATPTTGYATSFVDDMFTSWTSGDLDINIAKYVLWFTLAMFIIGILNFAGIPENFFLQILIGLPISFLTVAYITPAEIFALLTGYTALGLTLSTILPFIIMVFFTSMLLSPKKMKNMSVGRVLLQIILWVAFIGFLIYKLIVGYTGAERSTGMMIVMWAILGLSLLVLVFNKVFRHWIMKLGIEIKGMKKESAAEVVKQNRVIANSEDYGQDEG